MALLALAATLAPTIARRAGAGLAVFDWDNTCIWNDIGDATFEHAAATADLRLAPADFDAMIPESLSGRPRRAPIADALARRDGERLRAEMLELYRDLVAARGSTEAYRWVAAVLAGRTEAELEALADAAIERALALPPERGGMRLYRPIAAFVRALLDARWDVRIVSASAEPLVRAFARRLGLGPERVIGVRLARGPDGRLLPRVEEPFPYAEGKVAAIDRFLGRRPHLVAGDSPGDLPMLRASEDVRIVVERDPAAPAALEARASGWLVVRAQDMLDAS